MKSITEVLQNGKWAVRLRLKSGEEYILASWDSLQEACAHSSTVRRDISRHGIESLSEVIKK